MAGPYGVTSTGWNQKPLSQILADIQARQLAGISSTLDLEAPDPLAVTTGNIAQEISEVWELGGALYNGENPDNASGDQLASVSLITGTLRLPATSTSVLCTIVTSGALVAAAGTMFANISGDATAPFTNAEDFDEAAGTHTGVQFVAVNPGPLQCLASTLTVIAQPLANWTSITNPAGGTTGRGIETDAQLRAERDNELSAAGDGTAAALASKVQRLLQPAFSPFTDPDITGSFPFTVSTLACKVLQNEGNATDANGLPPHSIEAIAYAPGAAGDDDEALCALILATKSAGIGTYSGAGTSKNITDSQGIEEAVYYTRPSGVNVDFVIHATQLTGQTVTSAQIEAAVTLFCEGNGSDVLPYFVPGGTVYASQISRAVLDALPGLADVSLCTVNGGASVTTAVREVPAVHNFTIVIV